MHLTFKPAALGDLMNERIHALSIKASVVRNGGCPHHIGKKKRTYWLLDS